jgi:hypothetical protein
MNNSDPGQSAAFKAARIAAALNLRTRPTYNYKPTPPKRDPIKEMIGNLTNYVRDAVTPLLPARRRDPVAERFAAAAAQREEDARVSREKNAAFQAEAHRRFVVPARAKLKAEREAAQAKGPLAIPLKPR